MLSDRSIEGKPQHTFLLNSLDNIMTQASYILLGVILYGQQKRSIFKWHDALENGVKINMNKLLFHFIYFL